MPLITTGTFLLVLFFHEICYTICHHRSFLHLSLYKCGDWHPLKHFDLTATLDLHALRMSSWESLEAVYKFLPFLT